MKGNSIAFGLLVCLAAVGAAQEWPQKPPPAPVRTVTTNYFGVDITDPYRYMENLKDPEVQAWMDAQSRYAHSVLDSIPGHAKLVARVHLLQKSEPARLAMVTEVAGPRFFYLEEHSGENALRLYRRDGFDGKEVLLLNPDANLAAGAAPYSIDYFVPSFDAHYVAYGLSQGGSENSVLHVLDATTGQPLPDAIDRAQFGVTGWLPDGKSFLYNRLEKRVPNAPVTSTLEKSRIFLHSLGNDPAKDVPVFGYGVVAGMEVAPEDTPAVVTAPGSAYAIGVLQRGVQHSALLYQLPLAQLGKPNPRWKQIGEANVRILDFEMRGDELYLLLALRGGPAIVKVELRDPAETHWQRLLQLSADEAILGMQASRDALYITTLLDGRDELVRVPYKAAEEIDRVKLPFDGSVGLLRQDSRLDGALVQMSSWTRAPSIYRYDPAADTMAPTKLWPAGPYDQPSDVVVVNANALGTDGALVPLTILYQKGLDRDGTHPTLLIGYGSYSMVISPVFSPVWRAWLERGGVLAFAHVRGGGDYGGLWRFEGLKTGMVNRYYDFLACAQFLVDQGYTSPAHLSAMSGSAGGILVGRAITERPELFHAAIIESGLLDLLRFENTAAGVLNVPEFGSARTLEGFEELDAVSSYEHVTEGTRYPAVLLEAGMNDPRVGPWQSAKMAARLQAATTSGLPVLLNIDRQAGHQLGETAEESEDRFGDEMSFLLWQLGDPDFQPTVQQKRADSSAKPPGNQN